MAETTANGVRLYYELRGSGEAMVLVHGSWGDATAWQLVVDDLARSFRLLTYDRRGHSRSERPASQGSADEDGDDLAALLEELELAPAHVVSSSFGGNIALRLATRRPELFRSLCCHEPPLIGLLADDPESKAILEQTGPALQAVAAQIAAGDHESAARQFVEEVALGPGAWDALPAEEQAVTVRNAPTFLDELSDPEGINIDRAALGRLEIPVHLTSGSESPPMFGRVIDRLTDLMPAATHETIPGTGHIPHATSPEPYTRLVAERAREHSAA